MRSFGLVVAIAAVTALAGCPSPSQKPLVTGSARPEASKKPDVSPSGASASPKVSPSAGIASPGPSASVGLSLQGRILAPANLIGQAGGNIISNDGASVISTGGLNVISTGGLNYRTVLQAASETRIAGAKIRLVGADDKTLLVNGKAMETTSTTQGTYSFPEAPSGQTFAVVAEFKTSDGRTGNLRTVARAGTTADVDSATTLVAVGVTGGKGGGLSGIGLDKFTAAVETARKNLPSTLPDWTDPIKVRDAYLALETRLGLLEKVVTEIKDEVDALVEKIDGTVSTYLGTVRGTAVGPVKVDNAFRPMLHTPSGVTVGPDGALYIADFGNDRIVRVKDGQAEHWLNHFFGKPRGLAFGPDGSLYVLEQESLETLEGSFTRIVRVTPGGSAIDVIVSNDPGYADGPVDEAQFDTPTGIAVAADGTLYVADSGNHCIRKIANGQVTTLAGNPDATETHRIDTVEGGRQLAQTREGTGTAATFWTPLGIVLHGGALYVSELDGHRVRKVSLTGQVTNFAGGWVGNKDGVGSEAAMGRLGGLTVDDKGNLYVADFSEGVVRMIAADGRVQTVAEGLNTPIAVDYHQGALFVSESGRPAAPEAQQQTEPSRIVRVE